MAPGLSKHWGGRNVPDRFTFFTLLGSHPIISHHQNTVLSQPEGTGAPGGRGQQVMANQLS